MLYDEIVSYGAHKGYFDPDHVQRKTAIKLAQEYHRRNTTTAASSLPLACPSREMLGEYLNLSLEMEKEMVPSYVTIQTERQHVESFWRSTDRYCSVDIAAIERGTLWMGFFKSL
jgi:hypothetical protein